MKKMMNWQKIGFMAVFGVVMMGGVLGVREESYAKPKCYKNIQGTRTAWPCENNPDIREEDPTEDKKCAQYDPQKPGLCVQYEDGTTPHSEENKVKREVLNGGSSGGENKGSTSESFKDTDIPDTTGDCKGRKQVNTALFGCLTDDGKGGIIYGILAIVIKILTFGIGILATLGLVISGIQYATAREREDQVRAARKRIANIVIGLIAYAVMFAVLSWLIPGGIKF